MADIAILVARKSGCHLAADPYNVFCQARVIEAPVDWWGTLDDARYGKWIGTLNCCRRLAGLKRAESCPETVILDVLSLCSILGGDTKLERLGPRMCCPHCGTRSVEVHWYVPDPQAPDTKRDKQDEEQFTPEYYRRRRAAG